MYWKTKIECDFVAIRLYRLTRRPPQERFSKFRGLFSTTLYVQVQGIIHKVRQASYVGLKCILNMCSSHIECAVAASGRASFGARRLLRTAKPSTFMSWLRVWDGPPHHPQRTTTLSQFRPLQSRPLQIRSLSSPAKLPVTPPSPPHPHSPHPNSTSLPVPVEKSGEIHGGGFLSIHFMRLPLRMCYVADKYRLLNYNFLDYRNAV